MWMLMAVALQSGAVAGPFLPLPKQPPTGRRCQPSDTQGEIVVCGRSADADRLGPVADQAPKEGLPRAQAAIPGVGTLSGEVAQEGVGGFPSNRVMMRLKIPIGRARRN